MRVLGEICLFASLMATGYAAFLVMWQPRVGQSWMRRAALPAALTGFFTLTLTVAILVGALVSRDFRFEYVARYASEGLSWRYCVAALWVGQAGSLLLWAWMTNVVVILFRLLPTIDGRLREFAFGFGLANAWFLILVMVFAADPMAPSLIAINEGAGLNPLLQHPSMLVHPPIVFLAYSVWVVPCGLAFAALVNVRSDATWASMARPWAIVAWLLLGIGLLLGAHWAYQELGWGGYWGWDPVENGSLLPWLTGTALIHSMLAWRHRGQLKKTALLLAIVTYALCNFATFLTRSGIFSSVHAFSESPIGWLFLGLMGVLLAGGALLLIRHRREFVSHGAVRSLFARESLIVASNFLLLALAAVVLVGTLVAPVSPMVAGRTIQVGPSFYNNVLPPIGLGVLAMTAVVPLLQWGVAPTPRHRRQLAICFLVSMAAVATARYAGVSHYLALLVVGLAMLAIAAVLAAWLDDAWRRDGRFSWSGILGALQNGRRKYAAYCIHLGFVCVAVGVTGSSLGSQRQDMTLAEGDVIQWQGRQVRYMRLEQRQLADKLMAEAVLEVRRGNSQPVELRPARHLHLLQNEWTTEVAIHSTWSSDFYSVLNAGLGDGRIAVTLVENPLIRWIWCGGMVMTVSAIAAVWPSRRRKSLASQAHAESRISEAAAGDKLVADAA